MNMEMFYDVKLKETAYLLGFLWADSYINTKPHDYKRKGNNFVVSLEIVKKDMDELVNILDIHGKWCYYCRQRPNRQSQKSAIVSVKDFHIFLSSLGFQHKHQGFDKLFNHIPTNLYSYLLLGLSDGDGSFYINNKKARQWNISSCYEQDWTAIEILLSHIGCRSRTLRYHSVCGNVSYVRICNKTLLSLIDFMYPKGFEFGLKRKYDIALTIKNSICTSI
jgi:hypothetical protein